MSHVPSTTSMERPSSTGTAAAIDGRRKSVDDATKEDRSVSETEAAEFLLLQRQNLQHAGNVAASVGTSSSPPFAVAAVVGTPRWEFPPTPAATGPTSSENRSTGVLQAESIKRSIPHKKRRQHPSSSNGDEVEDCGAFKNHHQRPPKQPRQLTTTMSPAPALTLRTLPEGTGGSTLTSSTLSVVDTSSSIVGSMVSTPPPPVAAVDKIKNCSSNNSRASSSGSNSSNSSGNTGNSDAAWMHRLYPFDGPTIEEFTPLFRGVDIDQLVDQKLASINDKFVATVVRGYYDKVTQLDHNQYKDAVRPPANIPDDVRPFLLSRHQLKSFNSDFLRSALRKIKVNKSFCHLMRGDSVKGVPADLQNLGNEAFARSIRTHQIIAFFTRYHSLFVTKYPGRTLDLDDPEHKILLDCLRDIVRRFSAKKAIQRPVVDSLADVVVTGGLHGNHQHMGRPEAAVVLSTATPNGTSRVSITPRATVGGANVQVGTLVGVVDRVHDADPDGDAGSLQGTVETAISTLADEKDSHGDATSSPHPDGSFDSYASTIDTSVDDRTSSPGPIVSTPMNFGALFGTTPRSGSTSSGTARTDHDSLVAYRNVLSMLSDEARRTVEDAVTSMRNKVWEEARHSICQRSYEEGRRIGQAEGRMWGAQEALQSRGSSTASFAKAS